MPWQGRSPCACMENCGHAGVCAPCINLLSVALTQAHGVPRSWLGGLGGTGSCCLQLAEDGAGSGVLVLGTDATGHTAGRWGRALKGTHAGFDRCYGFAMCVELVSDLTTALLLHQVQARTRQGLVLTWPAGASLLPAWCSCHETFRPF